MQSSTQKQQKQPEPILHIEKPIARWDEALPLGNGLTGCLVWGDGSPLRAISGEV